MDGLTHITPGELNEEIDSGEQVTVVDVRNSHAFDEWHIDGPTVDAINVPANQLMAMEPTKLVDGVQTDNVVVVCNSGNTSKSATRALERSGIEARNLAGGMDAWANLYQHDELETEADATVVQFRRPSSGCLAYLVVSGEEAVVVDPLLAFVEDYVEVAREYGAEITHAVDTHVHADHVSGVRAFAARTDAEAVIPAPALDRGVDYAVDFETVDDGEALSVGDSTVEVVHTPGHTSGMTSYLVDDAVLLTGDGLFTESVARPDLEAGDAGAPEAAAQLHASLQERVLTLPDDTVVAPAHFSDGADPAPDGTYTSTVGDLAASMDALSMPEEEFVEFILSDMPPRPSNHRQIIETNLGQRDTPDYVAFQLELGPNNCAASQTALTD